MQRLKEYELIDVSEKHKKLILNWRNSEHVRLNMFVERVITEEEHNTWFENMKKGNKIIAKLLLLKGKPIGFVNFTDIDHKNNKCYWGFYIGDKEAPKGSGTIMAFLALNYIFEEFSLRKLCAEVLEFNKISINYHKKLGFVEEGRLKKHIFKNNQYIDVIIMALFRENWGIIKEQLLKKWRENSDRTNNY